MKRIVFALFILLHNLVVAQLPPVTATRNLFWGAASLNYQFNDSWTIVSDVLYRVEYTDGDVFQTGIRTGIRFTTLRQWQFTIGPTYFLHYPYPNGSVPRPELRGWQEVAKRFNVGVHHIIVPRVRLEQRFFREYTGEQLADHFTLHSWRIRFRFEYFYSFGEKENQRWSIVAGDELMFHRRAPGFTTFDQNRAWIGPQFRFSESFTAQITYLHILQQRNSRSAEELNVVRLSLQFTLTNRKENDGKK